MRWAFLSMSAMKWNKPATKTETRTCISSSGGGLGQLSSVTGVPLFRFALPFSRQKGHFGALLPLVSGFGPPLDCSYYQLFTLTLGWVIVLIYYLRFFNLPCLNSHNLPNNHYDITAGFWVVVKELNNFSKKTISLNTALNRVRTRNPGVYSEQHFTRRRAQATTVPKLTSRQSTSIKSLRKLLLLWKTGATLGHFRETTSNWIFIAYQHGNDNRFVLSGYRLLLSHATTYGQKIFFIRAQEAQGRFSICADYFWPQS